jgi:hypothetical protein
MGDESRGRDGVERRFADALAKARAEWAAADAAACAARAGCEVQPGGVLVPFFGAPHLVTHPDGQVTVAGGEPGAVHVAVTVLLLHYLLTASGAPAAGAWATFRELPGGLFYAASFADRAEAPLARAFAAGPDRLEALAAAARGAGGEPLELADAAWSFWALPRVPVAALIWLGDDELPGDARLLFDAGAGDYLPPEDLAGLGGQLSRRLAAG